MPSECHIDLNVACEIEHSLVKHYKELGASEEEILKAYTMYKMAVQSATGMHFDNYSCAYDSDMAVAALKSAIFEKKYSS